MAADRIFEGLETVQIAKVRVPIDPALMSETIIESLRQGRYEMGEVERLPEIVGPGERVVEIGAGIGFLTALIARRTPAELVVAIEANPDLIDYIEALHRLNGTRVVTRQAMVSPAPAAADASFHIHRDLWASSQTQLKSKSLKRTVETPTLGLAELAATYAPSLLIVDIEVLRAWMSAPPGPDCLASADFRPFAKVLIELKPKRFPPADVRQVFELFFAQGFSYSVTASRGPLVLFEAVAPG